MPDVTADAVEDDAALAVDSVDDITTDVGTTDVLADVAPTDADASFSSDIAATDVLIDAASTNATITVDDVASAEDIAAAQPDTLLKIQVNSSDLSCPICRMSFSSAYA
jgi:hypothetical protein